MQIRRYSAENRQNSHMLIRRAIGRRERGGECKDGEYLENIGNKTKKLKIIGRFYKSVEKIYKRVAMPVRDKAITIA